MNHVLAFYGRVTPHENEHKLICRHGIDLRKNNRKIIFLGKNPLLYQIKNKQKFSSNSEADTLELLDNCEEMLHR